MWSLVFRTLKFRKTGFIATFLAMFLGAAIVMGCGGLLETGIRMAAPPQRLAAAPVVVTGQQKHDGTALSERNRIDPGLVDTVRSVPGVRQAVPDVSFPATVLTGGKPVAGSSGSAGHNWDSAQLTPYALKQGAAPARDGEVVLDSGLAARSGASVGSSVDLAAHGTTRKYVVTGIADRKGGGDGTDPAVFFSGAEALRLAATGGKIDSIGVLPAPGTSTAALGKAVEAKVGDGATVLTGERRGLAELPGTLASQQTVTILASIFGSWAILIVMFGVASTLGLSLQQRQHEMALLRAIGTTSRQVRRMILGETAVLSVLATVLAVLPGRYLGELLYGQLTGHGVVSDAVAFREGWIPVAVGAVAAIAAALGATLFAGRRAARTKPVAALAESALQTRWFTVPRLLLALFFFANGILLSIVTATVMEDGPSLASTAGPASVLFAIGLALLAPGITKGIVTVLRLPVRLLTGLSGELALHNAATRNVRMAGAVAPIILLIGIATGTLYMQSTEDSVSARSYSKNVLADYVVDSSAGGFGPGVVEQVRGLPGVAGASELVSSDGKVEKNGGSDIALRGVFGADADKTLAVAPVAGSLDGLRGNTVALSDKQAQKFGVRVGDTLPVRLGDGTRTDPKVVALFPDNPKQQYLLLPSAVLAPHTTAGLPEQILVRADAGADSGALRQQLDRLAAAQPGAEVAGRASLTSQNNQIQQILVSANYTIVAMIVGYAAITVINALVAVTRQRNREFGLQRLTGATRGQVIGMLSVEGGLVAVIGTALGTVAAATTIVPYSLVKNGTPMPEGSVGIYLAIIGGALVLIFGATLVPSWRGMRTPPIETVTKPA
ncbi:FtsX-like permease family protein [Streptomyces telluris]|uniref:FtsX-like permease family protein n=1 Tax=Streptomyces telluris TaxID=2720021 RepID=A0A9X2LCE5_9ACTN|nr:FtsX-like permease family protein [Streptomyces telluris]MCQ8768476.1 FtsX-like permease family protein [Streptomyces telluris]NJP79138.1 FtsX-like permease family protein [Streptomyces telluris]